MIPAGPGPDISGTGASGTGASGTGASGTGTPGTGTPGTGTPGTGTPAGAGLAPITDDLRAFLASATGRDELLHIPPTAALFGAPVGLDSLTGTLLLREIQRRFGVDVAGEDLNLDSLATLGTLAAFVAERAGPGGGP